MRTFGTQTCRRPSCWASRGGGFTLLEILLVITIVGILASVVVLGATDVGRHRSIQAEAERLALAVELARTEALHRNEIWGLAVAPNTYQFLQYDDTTTSWSNVERRPFTATPVPEDIQLSVSTAFVDLAANGDEARRVGRGSDIGPGDRFAESGQRPDGESPAPAIAIYPGGEVTPFEIVVSAGDSAPAWIARSDGIQRTEAMLETVFLDSSDRRTLVGQWGRAQ